MNLDRGRLLQVLDVLKLACGNKVMEVSFFVKFVIDKENHSVYLNTTDYHTFLAIDFGDVSLTNLNDVPDVFLIKFKPLIDLVRYSTTEDVSMEFDEKSNSILVTTDGDFKFPCYKDPEQFPAADYSHTIFGEWDVPAIRDIWEKVSTVVSKDVTKLSYQGVNFDGNWAASDNRRFAIVMGDDENKYDGESMLIPPVLGDILSCCDGTVSVGRNDGGSMLIMSNPQTGLVSATRLIDATFVSYQRVIDSREPFIKLTLAKEFLLGVLQRLSVFTDKMFKIGVFTIVRSESGCELRCQINNDSSEGDEALACISSEFKDNLPEVGEVAQFKYQIDNLAAGIKAVDSPDEVVISFQEDGKLWIDEDNFHYLLSKITT